MLCLKIRARVVFAKQMRGILRVTRWGVDGERVLGESVSRIPEQIERKAKKQQTMRKGEVVGTKGEGRERNETTKKETQEEARRVLPTTERKKEKGPTRQQERARGN